MRTARAPLYESSWLLDSTQRMRLYPIHWATTTLRPDPRLLRSRSCNVPCAHQKMHSSVHRPSCRAHNACAGKVSPPSPRVFLHLVILSRRAMTRKIVPVVLCLAIARITALAKSNYAVVRGSILAPQHRPVPGTHITITAAGTGVERKVVSNATGLYEIAGLQPGAYTLAVESAGFKKVSQAVDLEVGQQATLDLQLRLGSETQTVTVQAAGELLKTQDASVGEVVDQRSVDSLPLNGRMLIDLVLTVPGAHISHGAATGDMNALYWRPGQRSAVSIGGSRPNANYFLLDGATNTDPTFSTQNFSASPDAVEEFQVKTGSYSAEMGGAGGGQINIVTRSGSSRFHGTAYEFLRNSAMDSHSFNQMGTSNFLVQNNFGSSIGGPISRKHKTFFFANYEALRHVELMTMVDTRSEEHTSELQSPMYLV